MQIEEVQQEHSRLSELLTKAKADLLQVNKTLVKKLKKDPKSLKKGFYSTWIDETIALLQKANGQQPQKANSKPLEENKDQGKSMVALFESYYEVKNAVIQQLQEDIAEAQQMLQKFSRELKIESANPLLKAPKSPKKSFNTEGIEGITVTIKNLNLELDAKRQIHNRLEEEIELRLQEAAQLLLNTSSPKELSEKAVSAHLEPEQTPEILVNLQSVTFTNKLFPTENNEKVIEFPNKEIRDQLVLQGAIDFWLAGVEYNQSDRFNFIASNGLRTDQKSSYDKNEILFPETIKQTRKVELFCYGKSYLQGFKFFDGDDTLICEVGKTLSNKREFSIQADEQIIGIKAKQLNSQNPDVLTDFQLMLCKRNY